MQIANEFSLGLALEQAWPLLTDLERVAPAMPGVTVEGVDGDDLRATMRVKVGPITVSYRTTVTLASVDEASRTAVLRARGRELRGRGTVDATVTAALRASGPSETVVALTTDLAVTGRVAQFGGGVMAEVADRLLRQFAVKLVAELEQPEPARVEAGPTPDEAYAAASGAGERATTASSGRGAAAAGSGAGGATSGREAGSGAGGATSGPTVDEAYSGAAAASAAAAQANGHAPGAAARASAPKQAEPVDLGNIAGAALLPGGPAVGAFLGALLGTFFGAFLAELLLRARR